MAADSRKAEAALWRLFRRALRLDDATPRRACTRRALPGWDSLTHVNLLLAIDARFGTNLAEQPAAIRSYADIADRFRTAPRRTAPAPKRSLAFLGNCHAYLVYLRAAAWLKLHGGDIAPAYSHVGGLLAWADAHRGLPIAEQAAAFERDFHDLAAPFDRFLEDADTLCLAQVFQLPAALNSALMRLLAARYPNLRRKLFLPTPFPPAFANAPPGSDYWLSHPFTPADVLTAERIAAAAPCWTAIDVHDAMTRFHAVNRDWSFRARLPAPRQPKPPLGCALDPTHCHDELWDYLFADCVAPALFETEPQPPAMPRIRDALQPYVDRARNIEPTAAAALFAELDRLPLAHYLLDEALKRIWHANPRLRAALLLACLDRGCHANLWGLIAQDDWLDAADAVFGDEEARALDAALAQETRDFQDEPRLRQCVAALCALYAHGLKRPETVPATRVWMDRALFAREWLFDAWQRCLSRRTPSEYGPPVACTPAALTRLLDRIDALVRGRSWLLYGAGTLSAYVLTALDGGSVETPRAVVSGLARERGGRFGGLPILAPEDVPATGARIVALAVRADYARKAAQRLRALAPRLAIAPLFEAMDRDDDLPATLGGRLLAAWRRNRFALHWTHADGATRRYGLRELIAWGAAILDRSPAALAPGDALSVALPTAPAVYALFYAACLRGLTPTLLSYPTDRRDPADYRRQLAAVLANLNAKTLICDQRLAAMAPSTTLPHVLDDAFEPPPSDRDAEPPLFTADPEQLAFLQHSSGTTGIQKAVPITHAQILSQVDAYGETLAVGSDDTVATWLPLYHDMGLITNLIGPPLWDTPVVACDPVAWVDRPALLLEMIDRQRATLCWQPNFAFAFLAKTTPRQKAASLDLSPMRAWINCAEPVTAAALDAFIDRFESSGVVPTSLAACYAMAETTFAISQTRHDRPPQRLAVAADGFRRGVVAPDPASDLMLVSSGEPLPISKVRILDDDDAALPCDRVGRIQVRSASRFDGYWRGDGLDRASIHDGWHNTGDLGFLHRFAQDDTELFVTGRAKDLIIIAGENYFPQDIEAAAEEAPGVKPGRSVAFGHFDPERQTETLVVGVEAATAELATIEASRIAADIRARIAARFERDARVAVLPPRAMIKSSAGKIARSANQPQILANL